MNCIEARDAMLAAELSELHAIAATTPLGAHLDACARCRSQADAIVSGTAQLGALLGARERRSARATVSRRVALVAALPIAAGLVAVIGINARRSRPDSPVPSASPLPAARHVSLTVAPGQRATVLKTADPTVTVIWLTSGDGQ